MKHRRITALLGAGLVLASTLSFGADPVQAASRSLTAQSTYTCQSHAPGQGDATDKVTLRMQLNVPPSVTPGQSITLGGVLTLQFNQRLYESSKNYGIRSVEGYSTTFSTTSLVNGKRAIIKANRFQTSPQPIKDPIVVSAPITFKPYTVPTDAKDALILGLPANGTTPNPVSSSPPTVAFTVYANADSAIGKIKVIFSCSMVGAEPGVLGKIPVAAAAAPAKKQDAATATHAPSSSAGVAGSPAAVPPAAEAGGATQGSPEVTTPGTVPPAQGAAAPAAARVSAPATDATVLSAADEEGSGVYLPTGLLFFGGSAICMVAIAYAAVTNARMRMIKRAMDG